MAAAIPTAKLLQILDDLNANANGLLGTIHLFQNDIDPVITNVAGDFTDATFTGYVPFDLSGGGAGFPGSSPDGSNDAESVHPTITFTQTGVGTTNNIYGYYWLDQAGLLVRAKRDPAAGTVGGGATPIPMDTLGKTYSVDLTEHLKR